MRVLSPIERPFRDEHVIGVDPPLTVFLDGTWRRRINAFTGRSLSHHALTAEQSWRSGAQRLRGQSVTPGVIRGLDIELDSAALGAAPENVQFQLTDGIGLAASGEDVVVSATRRLTLSQIRVHARADFLDALEADAPFVPAEAPPEEENPIAGLRPVLPRRTGAPLREVVGASQAAAVPRAAVLVLQPVTATILAGPVDDCPPDARDDPYDDLQLIDGARLLLYFWPSEVTAIGSGPDYALPPAGPARRNALAYRVFETERVNGNHPHPWEDLGVPIGLVGFNDDWTLNFIDRAAVTRLGGQPRPRTTFGPATGSPILWQARVAQFAEHLSDDGLSVAEDLSAAIRFLPPVGFIPGSFVDFSNRRQTVLPPNILVSATPIPDDQATLVLDDNASLDPVNLALPDAVELLVPVPADLYEPRLLEIETVDGEFATAIARFTTDRNGWFARREQVRRRTDAILDGLTGTPGSWPADGSPIFEVAPAGIRAPLSAERIRVVAAGSGFTAHAYSGARSTIPLKAGDRLGFWVRRAGGTGPTAISLRVSTTGTAVFDKASWWGQATSLPFIGSDVPATLRRRGDVPSGDAWVRLDVPVEAEWGGGSLDGLALTGLEFGQVGGRVEWGPVVITDAEGRETVLLSSGLPSGSQPVPSSGSSAAEWAWTNVLPAGLAEADYGVVRGDSGIAVSAIAAFRGRWTQAYLQDDVAALEEAGLRAFIAATEDRLARTQDRIDLAFVRARADIYRLRQIILGQDAASKLVTSPTLADLSIREESARARADALGDYLKAAYDVSAERSADNPLQPQPRQATPARETDSAVRVEATDFAAALIVQDLEFTARDRDFTARDRDFTARTAEPVRPVFQQQLFAPQVSLEALRVGTIGGFVLDTDVQGQRPRPGAVERTASVAERINPAPAVEIHGYALAGKADVVAMIAELIGGGADRPGIALADLPVVGYRFSGDGAPSGRSVNTLGDLIANRAQYDDTDEIAEDATRHEADYFAAATKAIDNAIAMLRLMEARTAVYDRLLGDARKVVATLEGVLATAEQRLRAIDTELAEARHDVATAQALLAEERVRVAEVNRRRAEIIDTYAGTLLFRRPRRIDRLQDIPTALANPAVAPSPIAVCRREDHALPAEVGDYIDLFQDLPAKAFLAVANRIEAIDRLDATRRAIEAMRLRAGRVRPTREIRSAGAGERFLRAVQGASTAQAAAAERRRQQVVGLDYGSVRRLDLVAARRRYLDHASMGDLIEGQHGRPELSRRASAELESVREIAACLHASFGEVPAIVRLTWAEALSEFDEPVPLSHLSTLPRWGEIDLDLRRELQEFVSWLFSRIDRSEEDANRAISELVRICMLMAAHAPVDRIIPARLVEPAPARPGSVLTLAADVTLVQIGMVAIVRNPTGQAVARASVEDISDGAVRARIVDHLDRSIATIATGYRIDLGQSGRRR